MTLKLATPTKYRFRHDRATTINEFSSPLQALLYTLDAIQLATQWTTNDRPNTGTVTPMDVDYNPFLLQSMTCSLYLTHPDSPTETTRYLIRPPRLISNLRGHNFWVIW